MFENLKENAFVIRSTTTATIFSIMYVKTCFAMLLAIVSNTIAGDVLTNAFPTGNLACSSRDGNKI